MLISITIKPVVSSDKTSYMSFCFFGTPKFIVPGSVFDVCSVVFQSTFNKFCLQAVAEFATYYANRHGALNARYTLVQRHYIQVYPANFLLCCVKCLTL